MFEYKRKEVEKFEIQNILKNGSPAEKFEALKRIEREKEISIMQMQSKDKSQSIEL